jgi:hypothetical protein
MTTIRIYDLKANGSAPAKLTPLPMAGLTIAAWNLLDQASDLQQPRYISISDLQSIDLQFAPKPSSATAITRWALRFGGTLTSEPRQTDHGPQTWYRAEFDYYGVNVCAYAHIPATPATT